MAPRVQLTDSTQTAIFRAAKPELSELLRLAFLRYPNREWATFIRCGWRETPSGLVLTLAGLDAPAVGDLDVLASHVVIPEPYTVRVALAAADHPLGIGIVHSHPAGYAPTPSDLDDDMDAYYAGYFPDFAPGRPYVSLILVKSKEGLEVSGRVHWRERWHAIARFLLELTPSRTWVAGRKPSHATAPQRTARLTAAFGHAAAARLRDATVAVIGAGGTGSAAIEVLARAGVGRLVIVDPDQLEESNLERVHGSTPAQAARKDLKVKVARDHVRAIAPECEVVAICGSLPQEGVIDEVISADVVLGCTDTQHGRVALSDLARRYLVPGLDCGVLLEGKDGHITGQIAQFTRFFAADPCPYCRGMIVQTRLNQELMSEAERAARRRAAEEAEAADEDPDPYWKNIPQLNTVGFHTTAVGSLAAGYAIGWITGRFSAPFQRMQADFLAPLWGVADTPPIVEPARSGCVCRRARGWSNQGAADALISAPGNWTLVLTV